MFGCKLFAIIAKRLHKRVVVVATILYGDET